MYVFAIFSILLAATSAEHCYKEVGIACNSNPSINDKDLLPNCNSKYGLFETKDMYLLEPYVISNIEISFQFLLMSTHFGNYKVNREGFKKLYRKLSDEAWDDAIDVIKFITKRGGVMNFDQSSRLGDTTAIDKDDIQKLIPAVNKTHVLELNELQSLSKALDIQKNLMKETLAIHSNVNRRMKTDASITHYLEENFVHPLEESIRTLAGYTNDLKNLLIKNTDASLSVFLFDEYLKSTF